MSPKLIDPARPPLPTPWNFPFQSAVGIQTSNRFAGAITPCTRQIGRAMLPTGAEFEPAGSDSTSMMVVSGRLRSSKVRGVQGAVVAATSAGASAPVAIMAMERTRRKKRRFIRSLLFSVSGTPCGDTLVLKNKFSYTYWFKISKSGYETSDYYINCFFKPAYPNSCDIAAAAFTTNRPNGSMFSFASLWMGTVM